jgi:hypothetical protein
MVLIGGKIMFKRIYFPTHYIIINKNYYSPYEVTGKITVYSDKCSAENVIKYNHLKDYKVVEVDFLEFKDNIIYG